MARPSWTTPSRRGAYHAIISTLGHDVFREQFDLATIASLTPPRAPLIDMRGQWDCEEVGDHFSYWRP